MNRINVANANNSMNIPFPTAKNQSIKCTNTIIFVWYYRHLDANVGCLPVGLRANKYLSTYKYCVNDSAASSSKNDQISRKYFMAYIGRKLYSHKIHLNYFKIREKA